jgi:hypothetical protein
MRQPLAPNLGAAQLGRQPIASTGAVPLNLDLDKEWRQIQNMLNAGIAPSAQRIKECLVACCASKEFNQQIDRALGFIAGILKIEEENVSFTDRALKEMLVLLEANTTADEIRVALAGVEILPAGPR